MCKYTLREREGERRNRINVVGPFSSDENQHEWILINKNVFVSNFLFRYRRTQTHANPIIILIDYSLQCLMYTKSDRFPV